MCFRPEGHAVCIDVLRGLQSADLVVHDSTQAHDADMDVVFFADQSGVFQSSPARQCVTTKTHERNVEKKKVVMKANKACFNKMGVGAHEHLNTNTSALDK